MAIDVGDFEYVEGPRTQYEGGAVFVRVCEKCGRFVKPDKAVSVNEYTGLVDKPNATCSKCGRTKMLFEGFVGDC